ncbi:unnamed protein product [Adineta ricciae]|uniref:Uncharacterized protein n=1 Tax=Adineta ricciae TaxID=249248 RepID=A0A814LWZ8_ADIRI|nr:unnamed protein product [Adineta ricciae]
MTTMMKIQLWWRNRDRSTKRGYTNKFGRRGSKSSFRRGINRFVNEQYAIKSSIIRIYCACQENISNGCKTVSSDDPYSVLLKKNVFILEGAGYCPSHVIDNELTSEAIDQISPFSFHTTKLPASDVHLLLRKWQILYERKERLDFDYGSAMSDDEYRNWTSLSRSQFEDLVEQISRTKIRRSSNR